MFTVTGQFSGVMKGIVTQLSLRTVGQQAVPKLFLSSSAKYAGSPLVRELISNDTNSINSYNNYLKAYQQAKKLLEKNEYILARKKGDEAFSQLVEVDTITAVLGKDFFKIHSLLEEIENKISTDSVKHLLENKGT